MMLITNTLEAYIPPQFNDGRLINHIILVCDVDGVIRSCTEGDIDPRVLVSIKELISKHNVDVAFISGTPVAQNPLLEIWRRGNITLDKAVGKYFSHELQEKKIDIYGAFGGQRITHEGHMEYLEEYPLDITFEVGKLLLYAFLDEVINDGSLQQKAYAKDLKTDLDGLKLINYQQASTVTADEFSELILKIRSEIDPHFRLISYGTFVETHTSNPPWNTERSAQWIQKQLDSPHFLFSQLNNKQKQVATGLAHRENNGFNFLLVSKTNKSLAMKKHMQEKLLAQPNALVVTIGDSQVDFPMHQHAHLAFHVGQKQVWQNHYLPHCLLVQDKCGQDRQHVAGTLHVLDILKKNIGKAMSHWNVN